MRQPTKRDNAILKLERARAGKMRDIKKAREAGDKREVFLLEMEVRDVEFSIAEMQQNEQWEAERRAAHAAYMAKRSKRARRRNPRRRAAERRAA